MPTEHEYKYVLDPVVLDSVRAVEPDYDEIEQGYLVNEPGRCVRIRKSLRTGYYLTNWFFTFKQKVGERVVEIEERLTDRDAEDLWGLCKEKLKKHRYSYDNECGKWEIDFFYTQQGELYFSLAEIELDEGSHRPDEVPDLLKPYILHKVDLTDDRFSNTKLGDAAYAQALLYKLKRIEQ